MNWCLPDAPYNRAILGFPFVQLDFFVANGVLPKISLFCCVLFFIVSCGTTDKNSDFVASLKSEHDTYQQIFQKSFQELKQQSAQAKTMIPASDSLALQRIALIDTKIEMYEGRSLKQMNSYPGILEKMNAGEYSQEQAQAIHTQFLRDFKSYEDAIKQLSEGLTGMAPK